jgi:hypothetical protein
MNRNQEFHSRFEDFVDGIMFTVDDHGNIEPVSIQTAAPGDSIVIESNPRYVSEYRGYVCAWREGTCCCSKLVEDLGGEPHMKASGEYRVSANAPENVYYVIYAITSEIASGPTGSKTTGELHVIDYRREAREREAREREVREAKEHEDLQRRMNTNPRPRSSSQQAATSLAQRATNASHSEEQVERNSPTKVELRIDSSIPEEAQAIIVNEFRRIFS